MAQAPDMIRNVAFVGFSKSGKTTLLGKILEKTGAVPRAGKVDDGSSVLDHDDVERERQHTIDPSTCFFTHEGVHVNAIDTPGFRDFAGHVPGALAAVECVVFLVDSDEGVRPHTRKLWDLVRQRGLPSIIVIGRIDREKANFDAALEQVQALDSKCVPLTVPVGDGPAVSAVEHTFGARKGSSERAGNYSESFMEAVVETDESLLEAYLGGEEIPVEKLEKQVASAVEAAGLFPVLATSAEKDLGVDDVVHAITAYAPPASDPLSRKVRGHEKPDEELDLPTGADEPLCALVFRTISDPFVGKLSLTRVFSGSLAHNSTFVNPHTGKSEKIGKLARLQGKEQVPVEDVGAGDIVAILKVDSLKTFDTICAGDRRLVIAPPRLPTPMYARALEPKTRTDEKKFSEALTRVTDEDPAVHAKRDARTGEMVVSGLSQLHLQTIIHRLKDRYHVDVNVKDPKIPYLETITGKGDERYRHKKQSGGAGEFAEVALRIEPMERGAGFDFANEVFGGAISEGYVQSSIKGVKAVMEDGVIAGYPLVDVKVTVYDGKEHPVDSKDVAFQKAGREAFKGAVEKAKPVILEPIVNLEVTFPAEIMGDITGDLNRRRARVQGMDQAGEFQVIRAQVPLAELSDYSNGLDAMTAGQGSFEIEPSHYEVAPGNVQQKIVEESRAAAKKDD